MKKRITSMALILSMLCAMLPTGITVFAESDINDSSESSVVISENADEVVSDYTVDDSINDLSENQSETEKDTIIDENSPDITENISDGIIDNEHDEQPSCSPGVLEDEIFDSDATNSDISNDDIDKEYDLKIKNALLDLPQELTRYL